MKTPYPNKIIPIILSGGLGKRLWPLSRATMPKPFLKLYNPKSLLQNTMIRCQQVDFLENPIVIANAQNKFIALSQAQAVEASETTFILEPECHNTAPSIALATLYVKETIGEDALLLIMPVDHKIDDIQGFIDSIKLGYEAAANDQLVIFGVKPTSANTDYGYIEVSKIPSSEHVYSVNCFKEKPNQSLATQFISDGQHYWNSGIYLVNVKRMISDFKRIQPHIFSECERALLNIKTKDNIIELASDAYNYCSSLSLDYAITEQADNIQMVELLSDWYDIGSWRSLYHLDRKNDDGDVIHGNVVTANTHHSYIKTDNHKLIVALGIENCYVIETRDAILLSDDKHLNELPNVLNTLEADRSEIKTASTVYKPWGIYTVIETSPYFQIKKIVVDPHHSLSLQEHQFRSEHWIILKGKATVTLGHEQFTVNPNESIFVPIGMKHRLENNEESLLEIIEIQTGSYLGEDDIKRYEDKYNRENEPKHHIDPSKIEV